MDPRNHHPGEDKSIFLSFLIPLPSSLSFLLLSLPLLPYGSPLSPSSRKTRLRLHLPWAMAGSPEARDPRPQHSRAPSSQQCSPFCTHSLGSCPLGLKPQFAHTEHFTHKSVVISEQFYSVLLFAAPVDSAVSRGCGTGPYCVLGAHSPFAVKCHLKSGAFSLGHITLFDVHLFG